MATPTCSKCGRVIPSEEINVAQDVAYCRPCNLSHKLSELTHRGELDAGIDLNRPPAGVWRQNDGAGTIIGATHRSLGTALGLLAISLFWNGIVSVFVLLAIAGTLKNMDLPQPEWFPAPRMNGGDMGKGMVLFLWIFLSPFILVGSAMIIGFLSCLFGRTEIRIQRLESVIYTGIGPLGYRRRFNPAAVKDVRVDNKQWRDSDGDPRSKTNLVIETREGRIIQFGSMLREDRRKFMATALRKALLQ